MAVLIFLIKSFMILCGRHDVGFNCEDDEKFVNLQLQLS